MVLTAHADLREVNELLFRHPVTLLRKPVEPVQLTACVDGRLAGAGRRDLP